MDESEAKDVEKKPVARRARKVTKEDKKAKINSSQKEVNLESPTKVDSLEFLAKRFADCPQSTPLLNGKIALSGLFPFKGGKEVMEELIESLGAKVSVAVTGKVDFLLHGSLLEDGRPYVEGKKYRLSLQKKVPSVSFEKFNSYILEKTGKRIADILSMEELPPKLMKCYPFYRKRTKAEREDTENKMLKLIPSENIFCNMHVLLR